MAYVAFLMSALLAGLAAYVAVGGLRRGGTQGRLPLEAALLRPASRAVTMLSRFPVVGALAQMGGVGRLCDVVLARVRRADEAGLARVGTREEACALLLVAWGSGVALATALFPSPLATLVALAAPVVALPAWEGAERRRRERALAASMPGVFRTLAMAMGAGETLAQAIDYVGIHEEGPAGEAFLRASMRLRCGMSADDALGGLAEELEAPGVGLLVSALLISQRTGSPLRELFQGSATLVERQGDFERILSVKTAQVRLSVRVVSLLPVVMVGLLALISPDFQRGLSTIPGILSLTVAALMDGAALLSIRSLMRGVL